VSKEGCGGGRSAESTVIGLKITSSWGICIFLLQLINYATASLVTSFLFTANYEPFSTQLFQIIKKTKTENLTRNQNKSMILLHK
jgi:hypothetical protein